MDNNIKIITSVFNNSPLRISVSYLKNGDLKQLAIYSEDINSFIEKEPNLETESDFVNAFVNNKDELLTKLVNRYDLVSKDEANDIVSSNLKKEVDINKVAVPLQQFILDLLNSKEYTEEDVKAWSTFAKRLQKNIDPYIRQQLFDFLHYLIVTEKSLALTPEGEFIAYKGVKDNLDSYHSGYAYVDNERVNGNIPNKIGSTISMKRYDVQADPASLCSFGLHVGSYSYANNFGETVLLVKVAPEDVVSVPNDYNGQKLRCCKYKVLKVVDTPIKNKVYKPINSDIMLTDLPDEYFEKDDSLSNLSDLDDLFYK